MIESDKQKIIEVLAKKLEGKLHAPDWASFVKTSHGKQRPPSQKNWWSVRAASILLKIQKLGPVGVSKLSTKYGTRKDRGVKPEKFARGSRNLIRKILQQLESNKYIEQTTIGVHKGRVTTKAGNALITEASKEASKR